MRIRGEGTWCPHAANTAGREEGFRFLTLGVPATGSQRF
jgi:hypothetical protein